MIFFAAVTLVPHRQYRTLYHFISISRILHAAVHTLGGFSDVTVLLFYQILTAGSIHLQTHIYTDNISVHINPAHSKTHIKSKRAHSLRSIGASHSNVVFATLSLFSVFRCTISLTRCNFFLLHPAKNIMCVIFLQFSATVWLLFAAAIRTE